jgi:hypothetical protein
MRRFDLTNIILTAVLGFIYFSFIGLCVEVVYIGLVPPVGPLSNADVVSVPILTAIVVARLLIVCFRDDDNPQHGLLPTWFFSPP